MDNCFDEELVKKQLGKFIKEIRKSEKNSLQEMAKRLIVAEATLRHWENGDRKMPEEYAIQYKEIFNLDKKKSSRLQYYYLDKKIIEKEFIELLEFYFTLTLEYSKEIFKHIENYLEDVCINFEELYTRIFEKMNYKLVEKRKDEEIEKFFEYTYTSFINILYEVDKKNKDVLFKKEKNKEQIRHIRSETSVAEIICRKRRDNNMIQKDAAKKLGISIASLSNYENRDTYSQNGGRSKKVPKKKLAEISELYEMNLIETAELMQNYFSTSIVNPMAWANEMAIMKMEELIKCDTYKMQDFVNGIGSLKKHTKLGGEIINFFWIMNWKVNFFYAEKKNNKSEYKSFLEILKKGRGGIVEPIRIHIEGDDVILKCKWKYFVKICKEVEKDILDYMKGNYDCIN